MNYLYGKVDSLTHIAIGACMGELFAGNKIGKRAMFLGAVAQSVPDIDFLASFWLGTSENLLAHRGFTHSFLFILLISPVLGLLAERWRRPHDITWARWALFFFVQALIHLLIDGMNAYGVGWFEPFNHLRVSYNWIFVADPLYSIWPGIATLVLVFLPRKDKRRRKWAVYAMWLSTLYLGICGFNKYLINREVKLAFREQHIEARDYFSTPTALNNLLWYVVASTDSGYQIGYRSVFDGSRPIKFHYVPRQQALLENIKDKEDLQRLIRFSKGFYAIEDRQDTLVFNDLRFGQMAGWMDPRAPFVFYYYLQYPDNNEFLVQRGRFAGWNRETVRSLWGRMWGGDRE